ncbi:DUF4381 domain-containing protein, partial [Francisella tularensis subsp. holarctica]|uniref:DUF4381 family protein n=1 Tax=Francisella tularensis TaxID=263 RepID=UPI002381BEAB
GWWLLLAVVILAIIVGLVFLHLLRKAKSYKDCIIDDFRETVEKTYQHKSKEVLQDISVYLKRVALQKFPTQPIKTLPGQ